MAFCECCGCLDLEYGIIPNNSPCEFFGVGLSFVNAGYVGNDCLDTKQEQLNVVGAAFWLYAINVGLINTFRFDEMMATPAPTYTSTLENAFVDNWCYLLEDQTIEEPSISCEIRQNLQEYYKDCCNTMPIGTCLNIADGGGWAPATPYVAQSIVIQGFTPWIRSSLNTGSVSPPGVIVGEWWSCGGADCINCWEDPTYPYWFISANTFPLSGFKYEFWTNTGTYVLDDRAIFDEFLWKATGAIAAGWVNRPGAVPGSWIKLS